MSLLQDRVVLVTGAGSGIGAGVASAIAEEGGRVIVTDVTLEPAEATASEVTAIGGQALAFALDVTDESAFETTIDRALEVYGRLDGLVNNAGVLQMSSALDESRSLWQQQLEVNVVAVASGCRVVARHLRRHHGGAIVNIASNAGKVGYPNMAAYNASKAAVINLTRSLAAEWSEFGINVNAVCPGGVATPMLERVADWLGDRVDEDPARLFASMVPSQLGRHIQPIEVGRVVAFLLSSHATIIRGQAINIDGGDTPY